jgi:DNA-binding response OmpR family regulator
MVSDRALAGLRVLVVEDEMLVSLLIEDVLAEQNCNVVGPFDTIREAVVAARAEIIDLAVLDVNVGGMKVYPVAEVLFARRIPFLFLSGYGQSVVPVDHPEWRVCAKPFAPEHLVAMLTEQVRRG